VTFSTDTSQDGGQAIVEEGGGGEFVTRKMNATDAQRCVDEIRTGIDNVRSLVAALHAGRGWEARLQELAWVRDSRVS
jgi:hypothetical protein